MIEAVFSPSGTICDGSATSPSAAITADRPSSSGTPAATSAPKASTRITSVIGSESVSAFLKSSAKAFESALDALAHAELADEDAGLAACDALGRVEHRADGLLGRRLVAAQLEVHQDRAAVLGDLVLVALGEGRVDVVDVLLRLDRRHRVVDRGLRRAGSDAPLVPWRMMLSVFCGREVLVDELMGLAGVADVGLLVLRRLDAERAADDERDDHEARASRRSPSCGAARSSGPCGPRGSSCTGVSSWGGRKLAGSLRSDSASRAGDCPRLAPAAPPQHEVRLAARCPDPQRGPGERWTAVR